MNRVVVLAGVAGLVATVSAFAVTASSAQTAGAAPPNRGAPVTGNQPTDALPHGGMAPYGKPLQTAQAQAQQPAKSATSRPIGGGVGPNAKSAKATSAPVKCQDGARSPSANAACSSRGGVDKATAAAEAQPGEAVTGGAGRAPVANAVPSGHLKAH